MALWVHIILIFHVSYKGKLKQSLIQLIDERKLHNFKKEKQIFEFDLKHLLKNGHLRIRVPKVAFRISDKLKNKIQNFIT